MSKPKQTLAKRSIIALTPSPLRLKRTAMCHRVVWPTRQRCIVPIFCHRRHTTRRLLRIFQAVSVRQLIMHRQFKRIMFEVRV